MAEKLSTEGPQDFTLFPGQYPLSLGYPSPRGTWPVTSLRMAFPSGSLCSSFCDLAATSMQFVQITSVAVSLHAGFCPRLLLSRAHPTPADILKLLVTFPFHVVLPGPCPSNCQILLISSSQFISVLSLFIAGAATLL